MIDTGRTPAQIADWAVTHDRRTAHVVVSGAQHARVLRALAAFGEARGAVVLVGSSRLVLRYADSHHFAPGERVDAAFLLAPVPDRVRAEIERHTAATAAERLARMVDELFWLRLRPPLPDLIDYPEVP